MLFRPDAGWIVLRINHENGNLDVLHVRDRVAGGAERFEVLEAANAPQIFVERRHGPAPEHGIHVTLSAAEDITVLPQDVPLDGLSEEHGDEEVHLVEVAHQLPARADKDGRTDRCVLALHRQVTRHNAGSGRDANQHDFAARELTTDLFDANVDIFRITHQVPGVAAQRQPVVTTPMEYYDPEAASPELVDLLDDVVVFTHKCREHDCDRGIFAFRQSIVPVERDCVSLGSD